MPWFHSIMSQDKFKNILRFLHLADNTNQLPKENPNYDQLHKLGGIDKELSKRFSLMYIPKRELSVDEQMIGTKARISFIQYMPKKNPKKLESSLGFM